ncbi:p6 protein [pistacia virus B]|uniref:P6 protein n=1 Tax=pistacia virus B TaxID=2848035 RepID=A0A410JAQ1_9VIRU|nr:p6 protein [Pistacia emaravirus]QAR18008.1 p6 protein [pistacia virus B]
MEFKSYVRTFNACRKGNVSDYYIEFDHQLFFSIVERMDTETHDQFLRFGELYDDGNIDIPEIGRTVNEIVLDDITIKKKAMRYHFRYIQILHSILGIVDAFNDEMSPDFHIFGTLVLKNKLLPFIPDNSDCLLLSFDIIKNLIWEIVIGYDPIDIIEKYKSRQLKSVIYNEDTVAYQFQVLAISYLAIRASSMVDKEKSKNKSYNDSNQVTIEDGNKLSELESDSKSIASSSHQDDLMSK